MWRLAVALPISPQPPFPYIFFCFGPALIIGSLMQGLSATQLLVGRLELTQTLNVKLRLFSVLYTVFFLFWLT